MFHIADLESRRLRLRWTRTQKIVFGFIYAVIVAIAFSPYAFYINQDRVWWLIVMALIVMSLHVAVIYYTLAAASATTIPDTELVRLTPIPTWELVLGKWWGVFREVWVWHCLAAIPKLGLAVGMANYLHASNLWFRWIPRWANQIIASPWYYVSHNGSYYIHFSEIYPLWGTVFLTLATTQLIAVTQTMFWLTCGLILGGITLGRRKILFAFICVISFFLGAISMYSIGGFTFFEVAGHWHQRSNLYYGFRSIVTLCPSEHEHPACADEARVTDARNTLYLLRSIETLQIAAISHIDGGIMVGANIMRAVGEKSSLYNICLFRDCPETGWQYDKIRHAGYVIRQLASVLLTAANLLMLSVLSLIAAIFIQHRRRYRT